MKSSLEFLWSVFGVPLVVTQPFLFIGLIFSFWPLFGDVFNVVYKAVFVLCHFVLIRIRNVNNTYKIRKHPYIFTIARATKNQNYTDNTTRCELF